MAGGVARNETAFLCPSGSFLPSKSLTELPVRAIVHLYLSVIYRPGTCNYCDSEPPAYASAAPYSPGFERPGEKFVARRCLMCVRLGGRGVQWLSNTATAGPP